MRFWMLRYSPSYYLHPEVILGLLTLLYAGTTLNFKYLAVTKLKWLSKSAGNNYIIGTSETLRNEITVNFNKEIIKPISEHVPKHLRPINDNEIGHYLAGLIDSNGYFNNKQQLIILFNLLDTKNDYKEMTLQQQTKKQNVNFDGK